jgi:hypothetical protein
MLNEVKHLAIEVEILRCAQNDTIHHLRCNRAPGSGGIRDDCKRCPAENQEAARQRCYRSVIFCPAIGDYINQIAAEYFELGKSKSEIRGYSGNK